MIDTELEDRLQLLEKRMHERFDHIHRRHKRLEAYLGIVIGLLVILILDALLSWPLHFPPSP